MVRAHVSHLSPQSRTPGDTLRDTRDTALCFSSGRGGGQRGSGPHRWCCWPLGAWRPCGHTLCPTQAGGRRRRLTSLRGFCRAAQPRWGLPQEWEGQGTKTQSLSGLAFCSCRR